MTSSRDDSVWPTDLSYNAESKSLKVTFESGEVIELPAEYLRVESPSAEVQAHGGEKVIVGGRRHVGIIRLEPVGNYAVRLDFDDLHDTGIYSWQTLYDLGAEYEERWARYLEALEEKGLSRDP